MIKFRTWAPPTNDKILNPLWWAMLSCSSMFEVVVGSAHPTVRWYEVVVGSAHPTVRWYEVVVGSAHPTRLRVPQVGHCPLVELKIHDLWRWGQTILTD
jgi:hypothetical protein